MILEDTNIHLFHVINSLVTKYPIVDQIAIFLADDLNTFFISFLVFLLVVQWIEFFYHHPRPFQLDLGHKLIGHGLSSSFPSQHTLTMVVIGFAYLFAGFKWIGYIGLSTSLIVGLSRVYVGVHFPFDVVGSFLIGFILVLSIRYLLKELAIRIRRIKPLQVMD